MPSIYQTILELSEYSGIYAIVWYSHCCAIEICKRYACSNREQVLMVISHTWIWISRPFIQKKCNPRTRSTIHIKWYCSTRCSITVSKVLNFENLRWGGKKGLPVGEDYNVEWLWLSCFQFEHYALQSRLGLRIMRPPFVCLVRELSILFGDVAHSYYLQLQY